MLQRPMRPADAVLFFSLFCALLGSIALAPPGLKGAGLLPTLPDLPLADSQRRLSIASSARAELLQVILSLTQKGAISLNTPSRVDAFKNVGKVANHPAVSYFRDLQSLGLENDDALGFVLAHSEAPRLNPSRSITRWISPIFASELSSRDKNKRLSRTSDALASFYKAADLEAYFEKRGPNYEALNQHLKDALPGDEPIGTMDSRLGDEGPAVLIIPSFIAKKSTVLTLPKMEGSLETQVILLPLPGGELPLDEALIAALRFEAVARARLSTLFQQFAGEIEQTSRRLNEGEKAAGIALNLSSDGLVDERAIKNSLLRALFLQFISDDIQWTARAKQVGLHKKWPQLAAISAKLQRLDAEPQKYPTFYTQLPILLEEAVIAHEQTKKTPLPLGDFEYWEGTHPLGWTINVSGATRSNMIMSEIQRLPKSPGVPSTALSLIVKQDTTHFREVVSEAVPVSPGDNVTLNVRVRSQDVKPMAHELVGVHVFLNLYNRMGALVSRVQGRTLTGTQPWQDMAISLDIPPSAATLQVGLGLGMPGQADFDDVSIKIKHPDDQYFMHQGGFEVAKGEAPLGWKRILASQNPVNGPSADSSWSLDQNNPAQGKHALLIQGGSQTSRWFGFESANIKTKPGRRVAVSGLVRAQDITRVARQNRNANLYVDFLNERGSVVAHHSSPILDGTIPWRREEILATAPIDAVWVRVGCILSESGAMWVDDIHVVQR